MIVRKSFFGNFNPRSHERSDAQFFSKFLYLLYFNPRSHERSDRWRQRRRSRNSPISIHAPTRGATTVWTAISTTVSFQSTLPREERHANAIKSKVTADISIHAPTRGATVFTIPTGYIVIAFQSTLPREERQQYCTKNLFIFIQYRQ